MAQVDNLTDEQKLMLKLSDKDIEQGRLISQKQLDKNGLLWLKSLLFGLQLSQHNGEKYLNIGLAETVQPSMHKAHLSCFPARYAALYLQPQVQCRRLNREN